MENIIDYEITRKFLNQGRWHVAFRISFNGKKRMPHANYVWLLNNQQFADIPPGYVIHHLDFIDSSELDDAYAMIKKTFPRI